MHVREARLLGREVGAEMNAAALRAEQGARRDQPGQGAVRVDEGLEPGGIAGQSRVEPERVPGRVRDGRLRRPPRGWARRSGSARARRGRRWRRAGRRRGTRAASSRRAGSRRARRCTRTRRPRRARGGSSVRRDPRRRRRSCSAPQARRGPARVPGRSPRARALRSGPGSGCGRWGAGRGRPARGRRSRARRHRAARARR